MALKLPRLFDRWEDQPKLFERYWDEAMNSIEESINGILELPSIKADIAAAQATADAAAAAAVNAGSETDEQKAENSIRDSYISNFTSPLISADTSGNVTIATHDRVYGDSTLNPTVSVTGSVEATGESGGSVLRFYYDDSTRSGGSVTYAYTVDPASPPVQTGNRHVVGTVEVPMVGSNDGNYIRPPGFVEAP